MHGIIHSTKTVLRNVTKQIFFGSRSLNVYMNFLVQCIKFLLYLAIFYIFYCFVVNRLLNCMHNVF